MKDHIFRAEADAIFASKRVAVDWRTGAQVKDVTKTLALSRASPSTTFTLTKTNPLLIVMDVSTGEKYARQVERKGVGDDCAMDWLVKDVSEELKAWRHQGGSESRLVFKTDSEFALTSLRDAVARFHGGVIVPERSARGESINWIRGAGSAGCGGVCEGVESKTGAKLSLSENITPWMVRWAAILCSVHMVGNDDPT